MAPRQNISLEDISAQIASKFEEAQVSIANHRKNCVALYKLHAQAAKIIQPPKNGKGLMLIGEIAFEDGFIDMINRVLDVKKGTSADRIVKFVAAYVKFVNEKIAEEHVGQQAGPSDSASIQSREEEETLATRFISRLLKHLFRGFQAKNKVVRQRSVHLVSDMMAHIGDIDEEMYNSIRHNLVERVQDKETLIRAHAVVALSKLVGTEDPDELEEDESTSEQLVLDALCFDSAPEVRRAALVNIPVTPETLPVILTRTRDVDTITRKLVFSGVLQTKLDHPRRLTIVQREHVIKAGLGDREPAVRAATGKLITSWFDLVMGELQEDPNFGGDDAGVMRGLTRLLSLFDVVGPGEEVAVDAMFAVFKTRPVLVDAFVFTDEYWTDLTPEKALLARAFVDHCAGANKEERIEEAAVPVLTSLAFNIQMSYNELLTTLDELELIEAGEGDGDGEAKEEELANKEMVLGELLKIVLKLDYADEIGKRKIFTVAREMLAHPHLPPGLIDRCLDVLQRIVPSERELIRIVVEIIVELRDPDEADGGIEDDHDGTRSDTTQSTSTIRRDKSLRRIKEIKTMTPEEKNQADLTDLRCLTLCIGMLERVDESFEDNSTLEGVLSDLIVPAVKRKESALREKGLISLGLCCLIAKNMAINSFQLFLSQVQSSHEDLKLKVLQIVFDLLILYDGVFLGRSEETSQQIITFVLQMLESEESRQVQTVLCIGICKLLLSSQITDTRVIASLMLTYVSPATSDNPELRQCLSYFFPLYCYSSPTNQSRMQSIFISAFDLAARVRDDLDEDQEMITLQQFGTLVIDWTDSNKLLNAPAHHTSNKKVHADLAVSIILALYDSDRDDEVRKTLCQFLGQLDFLGSELEPRTILKLHVLTDRLQDQCPLDNTTSNRTFSRFKGGFNKAYEKQLEGIDPGLYLDDEFREFYDFIGVRPPEPTLQEEGESLDVDEEDHPSSSKDEEPPSTPVLKERELNVPHEDAASPKSERTSSEDPGEEVTQSRYIHVSPMKRSSKRVSHPSPTRNLPASPLRKKRGSAKAVAKTKPPVAKVPQRRSARTTRSRTKARTPEESEEEINEHVRPTTNEESDDLGGFSE